MLIHFRTLPLIRWLVHSFGGWSTDLRSSWCTWLRGWHSIPAPRKFHQGPRRPPDHPPPCSTIRIGSPQGFLNITCFGHNEVCECIPFYVRVLISMVCFYTWIWSAPLVPIPPPLVMHIMSTDALTIHVVGASILLISSLCGRHGAWKLVGWILARD